MTQSSPSTPGASEPVGPFDNEHPPPLDFEAWADVSASLLKRDQCETLDILDDRELDIELWEACNVFWLDELASQLRRGNGKLATRYGRRCAAELQARGVGGEVAATSEMDPEETAFMTALPDETAMPFPSPLAGQALPFEGEGGIVPPAEVTHEPHPDTGETQAVRTLSESELPFDEDDKDRSP